MSAVAATNSGDALQQHPGVAIAQRSSAYPDIPGGRQRAEPIAFKISTSPTFVCGTPIDCSLAIKCNQASSPTCSASPPVCRAPRSASTTAILCRFLDPAQTNSIIVVSNVDSALSKVTVSVYITHTYDSDLLLELISPDGTSSTLAANNGSFQATIPVSPASGYAAYDLRRRCFDLHHERCSSFCRSFRPHTPCLSSSASPAPTSTASGGCRGRSGRNR